MLSVCRLKIHGTTGWEPAFHSFANAELTEDGIENLFDIHCADDFTQPSEGVVEIECQIFTGKAAAHCLSRALTCLKCAPQTIAMARVNRRRALGAQVLAVES